MLKFLTLIIFFFVTAVAPYASASVVDYSLPQNTEETETNSEEEVEEKMKLQFQPFYIISVQTDELVFPHVNLLKPQSAPDSSQRPPSA